MNWILHFKGCGTALLVLLCYRGYTWALEKFCRKHLGCPKWNGKLFSALFFTFSIAITIISEIQNIPVIVFSMSEHFFLTALVVLLFNAEMEKKIFAAIVLIIIRLLVGTFSDSLISCLVLILLDILKSETIIYIGIWGSYLIGSIALMAVMGITNCLSGHMRSVFRNHIKRWYVILSISLAFIIVVIDIVNFGASNGIMVVYDVNGGNYWNVYYNQLFSHIARCILSALSMCAAGVYVFGMDKLYVEQRKREQ